MNEMPFVFSKEWFELHQKKLLRLANSRVGRRLFRIKGDVPKGKKLNGIAPNSITWKAHDGPVSIYSNEFRSVYKDNNTYLKAFVDYFYAGQEFVEFKTTDFRTHDKFAARLYYGLKPLWFVLHGWDFVFGNVAKQLDFGFLTLTQYPSSTADQDPVNGWVKRDLANPGETLSTIRAGAGTGKDTATVVTSAGTLQSGGTANQFVLLDRGFFCFDTSALGASVTISATVLSLTGDTKSNDHNATDAALHIVAGTPASTSALANTDYGNVGSTSFGNVTYASFSIVAYNDITLNADGRANVSLTGISKFASRVADDLSGTYTGDASTSAALSFFIHYATTTATSTSPSPKLVVTYAPTVTTVTKTHTTDANKRKATTVTHTTDANKRKALTVAHTTDTLLHNTFTKVHTTDAHKRKAFTLAHTTDANKRKVLTVTHTTDALAAKVPLVTTEAVTAITKTTATGNGTVINEGGLTVTERGILVSISANPIIGRADVTKFPASGVGVGAFTAVLTGLTGGVTYHVVAYAINSAGIGYGTDVTFKTLMPLDKQYIYHVLRGSVELGVLQNVISEFGFSQNINSAGAQMTIVQAISPDTPGLVSPMGSNDDTVLIRNGNQVKVYEVSDTYPAGKIMFQGAINRWEADYVADEISTVVWSDGLDLDNYIIQGTGEVVDVTQSSGATSEEIYRTSSDYNYAGNTFITSAGITLLSALTIKLNTQNVAVPITVNIYSAVNGTLLGTSNQTVNNNAATDVKFVFSPNITTTALTTYFFEVIPGLNAGTVLIYYGGSNPYANGAMYIKKFQAPTSSGPLSPATTVNDTSIGGQAWVNTNNSQTSDNVYSTSGLGVDSSRSNYLKATNFGFSIPTGVTINGIIIEVERKMIAAGVIDNSIKIVNGGTISGTDQSAGAAWPSADTYASFGSSSNLWGLAWSPSDINASTFGVAVACKHSGGFNTASIDHIRITVYYTPETVWTITPTGAVSTASDLYFKTWTSGNSVEFAYSSTDPSAMLLDLLSRYTTSGGSIASSGSTVDNTGLSASYTFRLSTAWEAINKVKELSPTGWYFYVDVATDTLHFNATPTTTTYTLIKGKDLELMRLVATIENVINDVYFSGAPTAGVNLFKHYSNAASISSFGNRLQRRSDNRVTLAATADLLGNSEVNNNKDEKYQTEITVLDGQKDITLFKPGDTIGFAGFQTFVDNLILQIVRLDYSPDQVKLTVGVLPPRVNLTLEQLKRDMEAEQTLDNPVSPT